MGRFATVSTRIGYRHPGLKWLDWQIMTCLRHGRGTHAAVLAVEIGL